MYVKGKFVVIDGPDGVGKSTIVNGLKEKFEALIGDNLVCVNDPSSDIDIAKDIRDILKSKCKKMHTSTRLLLYLAARTELLYKSIIPATKDNKLILCDRYFASTYAYQGMDQSTENLNILNSILALTKSPDLEIIITRSKPFKEFPVDDIENYYFSMYNTLIERYKKYSEEYADDHEIVVYDIQNQSKEEIIDDIFKIINR